MITKNVTLTVKDDKATLSDKIILYQGDKGVEIYFTLSGFNYKFKTDNLTGVYADGKLMKPSGDVISVNNISISGTNKIKFTIDESMTDETSEVGTHSLQISLYDDSTKVNKVTIPPITFMIKEHL